MVLPLLPIIGAAGMGVAGTLLGGIFADKGKKEIHATKEHYAPVTTDARAISKVFAPTYQYQIDSPKSIMSSKKDIDSRARSDPDIRPSRTETETEGLDMTKIAIIGVVGLVAYGLVSKK